MARIPLNFDERVPINLKRILIINLIRNSIPYEDVYVCDGETLREALYIADTFDEVTDDIISLVTAAGVCPLTNSLVLVAPDIWRFVS